MELEKGDILFIYRGDEEVDHSIAHIFKGYNDLLFNHVGIYIGNNLVIEAIKPEVREVSLQLFLEEVYEHSVIVAKTDEMIKKNAADLATSCVGLPYNDSYLPSTQAFYCSSMVHYLFRKANNNEPFFKEHMLSFKDIRTGETMPFWVDFYKKMGLEVPEGVEGSHPSNLSLDSKFTEIFELNYDFSTKNE
ncbi:YiiX/YebB-like N1pC/P60 family cysteine hydrolase [Haloplasma contractile]|uniref:Orthopoxvirus of protein n=1 Tax=Haloplasma contractile SSD-17B TaxID=1033810 RepID=U2EG16_9MOLU|nr:YiiX/YebB-like N1pC/P60 family cysteine hydrolase [Haloplasma contractile]ERJ13858.1 Orthopoxvirus of protein [Haloplasma contractile SSD-17B]